MPRGWIQSILVLIAFFAVAALAGCAGGPDAVKPLPPQAPETELTYAPLEGDTASFRIHFYWNGSDRDGEVVRFRYALDADTAKPREEWIATTAKDTTLLFLVDPVKEVKGHVFWIVAEDNSGMIDATPAKRFFSAKTLPPTSCITRGPNAPNTSIGPNFTFEWEGIDPDGSETGGPAPVDSFEYLLLLEFGQAEEGHPSLPPYDQKKYVGMINDATGPSLLPPYDDWKWVGVRGLRKRFRNVTPGHYVFALRAVDIAGATQKNLKYLTTSLACNQIRDFNVTSINPGPQLTIESSVLNEPLSTASGPVDIARKEIQVFEGETITFSWTADASTYGGDVVGYTYALDDTANNVEWGSISSLKIAKTYTPQELTVGLHYLYVRVVDDGGLFTNAKVPIKIVHPTFRDPGAERSFLVVDDFAPPGGQPCQIYGCANWPSDTAEDTWWKQNIIAPLATEFGMTSNQFYDTLDPQNKFGGTEREVLKPERLAPYRVIIWSTDLNSPTGLWITLVGGAYSELAGYLRAGGTVIVMGFQLSTQVASPGTTVGANYSRGMCATLDKRDPAYKLSYFPRLFMGLDGSLPSDAPKRSAGARDFVEARVTGLGQQIGFQTAQVDTGGPGAKWNKFAATGDPEIAYAPGLPKIEGWKMQTQFGCQPHVEIFRKEDPTLPIAMPIYTYHGVPVASANDPYSMDGSASPREGLVVGIATQAHDLGTGSGGLITSANSLGAVGRCVFLGFPIYYIRDPQVYPMIRTAFAYVNASPTLPGGGP